MSAPVPGAPAAVTVVRTPFLMLMEPDSWLFQRNSVAVLSVDFTGWAVCPSCGVVRAAAERGISAEFVEYASRLPTARERARRVVQLAVAAQVYVVELDRPDPTLVEGGRLDTRAVCSTRHEPLSPDSTKVVRSTESIFHGTSLERTLRRRGITTVAILGTMASRTLRLAIGEAVCRGFQPWVLGDASVSETRELHAVFLSEVNGGRVRVTGSSEFTRLMTTVE